MNDLTQSVIDEIKEGRMKAFERLFSLYYIRIKNFAFGVIKDKDEAEEIAQNVLMKIWINRNQLTTVETINSYIYTIAQNEVHDAFRDIYRSRNYREFIVKNNNREPDYVIDTEYNIKEIKEIVSVTIEKMPEQRKLIYKLSRESFLSNDEIAQKLGLSKRTIEKHISLALADIKKNLGDFMFWFFLYFIS